MHFEVFEHFLTGAYKALECLLAINHFNFMKIDNHFKFNDLIVLQTGVSILLKRLIWKKIGSRAALLPETYFFEKLIETLSCHDCGNHAPRES